jgi:hypothetical protein
MIYGRDAGIGQKVHQPRDRAVPAKEEAMSAAAWLGLIQESRHVDDPRPPAPASAAEAE